MTAFDSRLAEVVRTSGMKKEWLAKVCGVDPSTFSRWLSRERKVDPANQIRLCALLHRNATELFDESDADGYSLACDGNTAPRCPA